MKKLFLLLALMLFIPSSSMAGGGDEEDQNQYWICHQVGTTGKHITVVLSQIFYSSANDYYEKGRQFEDQVEEELGEIFHPEFDARCEDYSSEARAKRFLKRKVNKYHKRGYKLFWLKFLAAQD